MSAHGTVKMTGKATKPDGGFVFIPASLLIATWWAYKRRFIEFGDVRVWLACQELPATRCSLKPGRVPAFRLEELASLSRLKRVGLSVARLERAGLLAWSEARISFPKRAEAVTVGDTAALIAAVQSVKNHRRKVPVPRRLLKFLARARRPAIVATALGHLLRCMYYRDEGCSPIGRCKASWIAEHFEMDLRNIKSARKELHALGEDGGLLIRHDSPRWTVNKFGPRVEINLTWSPPGFVKRRKSPPRETAIRTESPPPDSYRELSSKVTRTRNADSPHQPGACMRREPDAVSLRDVRNEYLRDAHTLRVLYQQAVGEGIVSASESDELRFFAAAEHARVRGSSNPPGLFVAVIRRGLWTYITQCEEDAARKRIQHERHDRGDPRTDSRSRNPNEGRIAASDVVERAQIRDTVSRSLQRLTELACGSGQAAAGLALVPSRPGSVAAHPNAPAPPRCSPPPVPEGAARSVGDRHRESGTYHFPSSGTAKQREKTRIGEKP